jgi:hypothetical protein
MQENIAAKVGLILSFSLILIWGARLPVVRLNPPVPPTDLEMKHSTHSC